MLTRCREGPKETNYFLESRSAVPLQSAFKATPVLLSRKGPPIVQTKRPTTDGPDDVTSETRAESSEDEDENKAREQTLAERKAQAAKDREEKQRKYEERRQELFGTPSASNATGNGRPTSRSGTSTPTSLTPPGSRSSTPSRGRGRGRGRGGINPHQNLSRQQGRPQELYDPSYSVKPDSISFQRRESPQVVQPSIDLQRPIRAPKGPDGSGRGGFGFSSTRESRHIDELANTMAESVLAP